MTKNAHTIRMEYSKAKEQADQLEKIARDLKKAGGEAFGQCLSDVNKAWKSESSKAYIRKGKKLQARICSRAAELEKMADVVRRIAQNTYQAEMKAIRIAETRGR